MDYGDMLSTPRGGVGGGGQLCYDTAGTELTLTLTAQ